MNYLAPRPFQISEAAVAGGNFLASPEIPYIRVSSEKIGIRATRFSVTSPREVGRDFISQAMTYPLGEVDDWKEVEKGLRNCAYPSRAIKRLHGSVSAKARLTALKPSSVELADILKATKNTDELNEFIRAWRKRSDVDTDDTYAILNSWVRQDEEFEVPTVNEEYTANIPVMSGAGAILYVERTLKNLPPEAVAPLLLSQTDDPLAALAINVISSPSGYSDNFLGLKEIERYEIGNSLMRAENPRGWIEVVHQKLDELLVPLREEAKFEDGVSKGGGYDSTVYIRKDDLPKHLRGKPGDIRILVGPQLRDADRKSGLPRNKVKFIRRKKITVAHPQVVWVNRDGVRHFEYPSGRSERSLLRPVVAKPNSLIGAAIFANIIGMSPTLAIRYNEELNRLIGKRSKYAAPLARAGLLGLVLHTRQEELLSHPYFEMIEERALQ